MTIRTILVPVGTHAHGRSAVETAVTAAAGFGAHVEGLHVRTDPRTMIPYVGEGMSGALVEEVIGAAERETGERSRAAHDLFMSVLARHGGRVSDEPDAARGLTGAWRDESGREDELIAVRGRVFDLVVVSRPHRDAEVPTATLFETALFETGQPLLVAPPEQVAGFGARIMIGWNGSPEAARAVSAALPFLERAESVFVLSVASWGEGAGSAEAVARRLAWHGIAAPVRIVTSPDGTVGETVLAEAAARAADMIVMGAYTQSRLRQMILGGVTRHVLGTATVPLLMAH